MVDFAKRLKKPVATKQIDPVALYDTLDRASDKGPLRPAQLAVLKEWHETKRDQRDLIVKLHTGEGKTLIGLLMLQSKLNEGVFPALYLCPNKFLVSQTMLQAKQFGIGCVSAMDDLPNQFIDGESILVTTVKKLFNGLTKFRLDAQSLQVGCLLMDDSHACIEAISDSCVISLDNSHPAYRELIRLFEPSLMHQGHGTFSNIQQNDPSAILPVPYWEWRDHQVEVVKILAKYCGEDKIKFRWPLLRDQLHNCMCVFSGTHAEISPYLPPLFHFGSYHKANHRIFMSATVTNDAFLVKGLGLSEKVINSPLIYPNEKWSGEKMILIPSLVDESLTRQEMVALLAKPLKGRNYGVVEILEEQINVLVTTWNTMHPYNLVWQEEDQ